MTDGARQVAHAAVAIRALALGLGVISWLGALGAHRIAPRGLPSELLAQNMAKYQVIEDFGPLGQSRADEIVCLWILI